MKSIKFIIKSFLLIVGMMGIVSCNDDENAIMQDGSNLLKITTSIAETRSVITGTTFKNGDQIGVYVMSADGHTYTGNSSNIKAARNDAGWQLGSDVGLKSDAATVYAYYPYNANASGIGDSIDINIAPAANIGQTDYMYGSCSGINSSNTTANIKFNHALARITLAITKGSNDIGKGILSKVKIENDTLYAILNTATKPITKKIGKGSYISTKGKMDIKTGGIKRIVDQNAAIEVATNYTISEGKVQYIDLLVEPPGLVLQVSNQRGGKVCAILTIDGSLYKISLGYPKWEAGKQYTYPITINRGTVHAPAKVGDYYYSDGSSSTTLDNSKTCIGVVFALTDIKGGEINENLNSSYHGRIIALEDVSVEDYSWCTDVNNDVENIETYKEWGGIDQYGVSWPALNNNGAPLLWPTYGVYSDFNGPKHKQWISTSDYPASYACQLFQTKGTNVGDWYLPSFGEMRLIKLQNIRKVINLPTFINTYWTSTEVHYNYYSQPSNRAVAVGGTGTTEGFYVKTTLYKARAATTF